MSTFKTNTLEFWKNFQKKEAEIIYAIENNHPEKSVDIIHNLFLNLIPGIPFLLGGKGEHFEFFLSPEGNRNLQILARYWLDFAPKLDKWTFYSSKQPGKIEDFRIKIFDQDITSDEFYLSYQYNNEYEKIDVSTYHDSFKQLDADQKVMISFLALDVALGEYGTELWIGEVKTASRKPKNSISIVEFKEHVNRILEENKLDKNISPDEIWCGYRCEVEDKDEYKPREDVFAGSTTNFELVQKYNQEDLLEGIAADYIFIMMENKFFTMEKLVEERGAIEDSLDQVLTENKEGYLIGGATGIHYCYIDLIIFDGENSINTIINLLHDRYPQIKGEIHYFAEDKNNVRYEI